MHKALQCARQRQRLSRSGRLDHADLDIDGSGFLGVGLQRFRIAHAAENRAGRAEGQQHHDDDGDQAHALCHLLALQQVSALIDWNRMDGQLGMGFMRHRD